MTETKTRVRWTEEERRQLAVEMTRLLHAEPGCSKLQALLKAQGVLPEPRRRAVAAWTMVREQIEPHMKAAAREAAAVSEAAASEASASAASPEAMSNRAAAGSTTTGDGDEDGGAGSAERQADGPARTALGPLAGEVGAPGAPAALAGGVPVDAAHRAAVAANPLAAMAAHGLAGALAQQLDALGRLGAQALEAAVLQVLSSPAVAERLDALLQGALQRAAAGGPQAGAAGGNAVGLSAAPAVPPARALAMPRPKVLVAGLTPAQANELVEEFSESLDLRTWRPGETKDQLRSLGRVCSVAVLVAESVDHDTESMLKSMHLRIVKHAGGLPRLKERLHELVDSGMFNVLT